MFQTWIPQYKIGFIVKISVVILSWPLLCFRRGGIWWTPKEAFCCWGNGSCQSQQLHSEVRKVSMSHVRMLASGWRSNPPPASPLQCFSDSGGIPLNRKHHSTIQSSLSLSSVFFHSVYSPAAPRTLTTPLCRTLVTVCDETPSRSIRSVINSQCSLFLPVLLWSSSGYLFH